jgi:hypothetical protein
LITEVVLGNVTRQELWKSRMKKSSLGWIVVVASGCVFTDLKEIPQQIGLIPSEDAATDSSASDASVDDLGADGSWLDSGDDVSIVDMEADSTAVEDVGVDAEADMPLVCWGPRTNLPSGNTCENTPTSGSCKIVKQDCPGQTVCAFVFNGALVPACIAVEDNCAYLKIGDPCMTKAGQMTRPLGTCEPGAYCPPGAIVGVDTQCRWYCELGTGLGCESSEVCQPISPFGTAQKSAGYGVCEPGNVCVAPL